MIIKNDLVFNFDGFVTIVCGRVILQNFFKLFCDANDDKAWKKCERLFLLRTFSDLCSQFVAEKDAQLAKFPCAL